MAVEYTLELFPTEGNWNKYAEWFGEKPHTDGICYIARNNDNAGVDLYCVRDQRVGSMIAELLDLGVKARMIKHWKSCQYGNPVDHEDTCHFWLAPRSSIWKSGVRQANSIGVIDRSYRGVLMGAVLANNGAELISADTRLFQVLAPDMGHISMVKLMPESMLDNTSRGAGGFGSTGK